MPPRPAAADAAEARVLDEAGPGETFTTMVGRSGRFTLSLPPGAYRVTGRSPLTQAGQMICPATAELHVSHSKPAHLITVVCSIP